MHIKFYNASILLSILLLACEAGKKTDQSETVQEPESSPQSETVEIDEPYSFEGILVFSDEFEDDGLVDIDNWKFETEPPLDGGWYNGEKQHYTDREDNAYISDGTLKIVAKKEEFTIGESTKEYTSARLNSNFSFTYGKIEVKAKLPEGAGTWPAIWTMGVHYESVGWPECGEVDIMEHWGHEPTKISSATHTVACSAVQGCDAHRIGTSTIEDYSKEFHVYAMMWTPDEIGFLINDKELYSYKPEEKTEENWPFEMPQYILLNVAMGGSWFEIDPNFQESQMEIDYVRVYQ